MSSNPVRPLRTAPGNGQELVSRDPAARAARMFRRIDDGEPRVDPRPRLRDEVDALAERYVPPTTEDTIEREAFLYSAHPGKHLVPFYLWLSIRGYGTFDRGAA